jgi:hypothetical protein
MPSRRITRRQRAAQARTRPTAHPVALSATDDAHIAVRQIRPAAIIAYIDSIQIWLKRPLRRSQQHWLESVCDGPCEFKLEAKQWQRDYVQRIQLRRPQPTALEFLSQHDALLNYVELALDWTFDCEAEKAKALAFVDLHLVKRWHGNQQVHYYETTRYTAERRSANNLVIYADRHCRITGEVDCLHFEWRMRRAQTLQRAGLATVADLLDFDHRQFWRQRLLLYALDIHELGRQYNRNVRHVGPLRGPWTRALGSRQPPVLYDYHRRMGHLLLRLVTHPSVQAVIDEYRNVLVVSRCLRLLNVRHLLPALLYDIRAQTAVSLPSHCPTTILSEIAGQNSVNLADLRHSTLPAPPNRRAHALTRATSRPHRPRTNPLPVGRASALARPVARNSLDVRGLSGSR